MSEQKKDTKALDYKSLFTMRELRDGIISGNPVILETIARRGHSLDGYLLLEDTVEECWNMKVDDKGSEANVNDSVGETNHPSESLTPLQLAIGFRNKELIENLIHVFKCSLRRTSSFGWTAIHFACAPPLRKRRKVEAPKETVTVSTDDYYVSLVRDLLSFDPKPANFSARDGRTCACLAASWNLEIIQLLQAAGVDMYAADSQGMTAVHYAAINGKHDIVWELAKNGERRSILSSKDSRGRTTFNLALEAGSVETLRTLIALEGMDATLESMARIKVLPDAALNNTDIQNLMEAIKLEGELETPNANMFPIHSDAAKGRIKSLQENFNESMIEDYNQMDDSGYRPIHWAIRGDHLACVRWLIEAEPSVDVSTKNGQSETVLEMADRCSANSCAKYFRFGYADKQTDTIDLPEAPIPDYMQDGVVLQKDGEEKLEYQARLKNLLLNLEKDMALSEARPEISQYLQDKRMQRAFEIVADLQADDIQESEDKVDKLKELLEMAKRKLQEMEGLYHDTLAQTTQLLSDI
eukprot:m.243745 g.243745  ORF g.243745 m.243745 type:complete len:527 (-) comp16098_c0_seq32:1924-3504(-)